MWYSLTNYHMILIIMVMFCIFAKCKEMSSSSDEEWKRLKRLTKTNIAKIAHNYITIRTISNRFYLFRDAEFCHRLYRYDTACVQWQCSVYFHIKLEQDRTICRFNYEAYSSHLIFWSADSAIFICHWCHIWLCLWFCLMVFQTAVFSAILFCLFWYLMVLPYLTVLNNT